MKRKKQQEIMRLVEMWRKEEGNTYSVRQLKARAKRFLSFHKGANV